MGSIEKINIFCLIVVVFFSVKINGSVQTNGIP